MARVVALWFFLSVVGVSFPLSALAQTANTSTNNKCIPPQPTYSPNPLPPHMKSSGVAAVDCFVNEKGRVSDAKLRISSGSDEFDRDAVRSVKEWKFKPAVCGGKKSPAHIVVELQSSMAK